MMAFFIFAAKNEESRELIMVKRLGVLCTLLIIINALLTFFYAGKFLIVDQSPRKSDAIILLTGGGIERLNKSVELYQKGFAPVLIISNSLEDGLYSAAVQLGVPEEKIIKETKADSTATNAFYTYQMMKEHGLKSAIVVSSDYHMRRVKFNFDRVYSHSGIQLTYCAAASGFNPDLYLLRGASTRTAFNEYVKLVGNAFGFNGDHAKEPLKEVNDVLFSK